MNDPDIVVFDWDSTLVDNWGAITVAFNRTLSHFGMEEWSEETVRARAKKSMRDSFPDLFGEAWEQASDLFYQAYDDCHCDMLRPLSGAEALLQALLDSGTPMSVVSNKTGHYLRAEAEQLAWTRYFHRLIGAGDAVRDKPSKEPLELALEGMPRPEGARIWYVGDSAVDMIFAHVTGCSSILLHPDDVPPEDMTAHPPALHLPGCDALKSHLGI